MKLDYRPRGAARPRPEPSPLERAERRGWVGMAVWVAAMSAAGLVLLVLLAVLRWSPRTL